MTDTKENIERNIDLLLEEMLQEVARAVMARDARIAFEAWEKI